MKQVLRAALDSLDPRHKRIAEQTRAVLFLATPHSGATLASLALSFRVIFRTTVSLQDLQAHDAHLADLFDFYRNHSPLLGIVTRTYYEQREVRGVVQIVDSTSAHPGVGENPVPLDEDHLSIAKPRDHGALVYLASLDLLRRHVLTDEPRHEKPPPAEPIRPVAPVHSEIVVRVDTGAPKSHPIPCQLPPAAAQFFGRAEELRKLEERLRAGRSTAVVGPAGLGKTALAAEVLRRIAGPDGSGLPSSPFPDGIVFLDLYLWHGQAEPVWNTLASSLEGGEFRERSPARERATEACRGRRFLMVVEGGEQATGSDGRATIDQLFEVLDPENRWLLLTRNSNQATPAESVSLRDALEPGYAEKLLEAQSGSSAAGPLRQRVLALLEGHPLALTWAGDLLARGDEPARLLVEDWEKDPLLGLSDPTQAQHSLRWLFERSTQDLDQNTRRVMAAAGLLANAPFPLELIEAAVSPAPARAGLRTLVQRGFLRLAENEELWQFGHVLAYRFARAESGSDPRLRESLAAALERSLGAAFGLGGDLASMATKLDHAAALLRADEDHRLLRSLASPMLYVVSSRLVEQGRLPLVQSALAAFRGWLEELPAGRAEEDLWTSAQSVLLDREGDLRMAQGDLAMASDAYRKGLKILFRLAEADPSDISRQRDLSVGQDKVGDVLKEQGAQSAALAAYRQSLEIRQRLAAADPSNLSLQRDLGISHSKVGDVLNAQGAQAAALYEYRQCLDIGQRLAAADPSNVTWQQDLSTSYQRVGDVLQQLGDPSAAFDAYRQSLEIIQRMAAIDSSNLSLQRHLSVSHNKVGDVLKKLGNQTGALDAYRQSLEIVQRLATADPSNAIWQTDLSATRERLGDVLETQGDLRAAHDVLHQSLQARQRLAADDPSNTTWQRDLSFTLFRLAALQEQLGEPAEALRMAEASLAIDEKLAALDPTNVTWQNDVKASRELVERLRRG